MSSTLPVFQSESFIMSLRSIPRSHREDIILNLKRIDNEDIRRIRYLKGEFKHLKKYRIGDYRIFLSYCAECYNKFRKKINCNICDENFMERIVVHSIDKRPKLYKKMKRRYT